MAPKKKENEIKNRNACQGSRQVPNHIPFVSGEGFFGSFKRSFKNLKIGHKDSFLLRSLSIGGLMKKLIFTRLLQMI